MRFACYSFIALCVLFLNHIDVKAATFSSTSVRTAYWYDGGDLYDDGFITTNPRSLPQYVATSTKGPVSLRLFQWRYSTNSALSVGSRYKISTDITFSSVNGIDIDNFLNGEISELRCGTTYSNASEDNLTIVSSQIRKESETKFQINYTIDVLSNNCTLFSGIVKWGGNEYDTLYNVNYSGTGNSQLSFYVSYKEIEVLNNQDIIDNANQNTQDILDSQDKINDAITSESDDFESKSCGIICKLKKLPSLIVDGIKSLFVPDSEDLNSLIDDFKNTMSEKLGVIYQSGELIIDIFQGIIDDSTPENACLTFPELKVPNVEQPIINETDFCFDEVTNEIPILLTIIRGVTGIFITLMFINMLKKKYDTFINGGDL